MARDGFPADMVADSDIVRARLLKEGFAPHRSHWGTFYGRLEHDGSLAIRAHPSDPNPSPILANLAHAARHPARIARPVARKGWLIDGPGPDTRRGLDEFVELSWSEVTKRLSRELSRVYGSFGAAAVYGGSYGWSSAGRLHHAQSQLHRFLNCMGGYVRSLNTYSSGAANVILPRVIAPLQDVSRRNVTWGAIERHTELLVCFGGMASKNAMVSPGGTRAHSLPGGLLRAQKGGTRFISISPLRDDFDARLGAKWLCIRPGTDTALMLALAYELVHRGLHDQEFLHRYCTGFGLFAEYLMGRRDGQPKTASWAASITGIDEIDIVELALDIARSKTLINVSQSLQRAPRGEQPIWMALTLAALRGQIGLPGAGFIYGLGSMAEIGNPDLAIPLPTFPQGDNPVTEFIPVARLTDMLLGPGSAYEYNGRTLTYPNIRLVYWAGGNPFHHHQDLNRLREAFFQPDTIVVHESFWTATARHADIILPVTMTVERNDIGAAAFDPGVTAMHRLLDPFREAKDDYDIFGLLAGELGVFERFTEGRSSEGWLQHMYGALRESLAGVGVSSPSFDEFWKNGELLLPTLPDTGGALASFRRNPESNPLGTPSGKIEIFSEAIAGFGYEDCLGHPTWFPLVEADGRKYPICLIANQPVATLHSQLDFGEYSAKRKVGGRASARISPDDAASRGIMDGSTVRIFNNRGACLATAAVSDDVPAGVVQLPTGAWFDPVWLPDGSVLCVHGNPNVLTSDVGTSRLAQGCTGQICQVQIERFECEPPKVKAFFPPASICWPGSQEDESTGG